MPKVSVSEATRLLEKAKRDGDAQERLMQERTLDQDWKAADLHRNYMNQFRTQENEYRAIIAKKG